MCTRPFDYFLCIYLSIYLSSYPALTVYLPIYLSICLSSYTPMYLSIYLFIYRPTYLYVYLSIYLGNSMVVLYLSPCIYIYIYIYIACFVSWKSFVASLSLFASVGCASVPPVLYRSTCIPIYLLWEYSESNRPTYSQLCSVCDYELNIFMYPSTSF